MADVPHFKVPLELSGSGFATVEQDSADEVEQCVEAILRTPLGALERDPEFGIPDPTFGVDLSAISASVDALEPRAALSLDEEWLDEFYERIHAEVDLRGGGE